MTKKLLKAGGIVYGYIIEAVRPLTAAERTEAGIILPHEIQGKTGEERLKVLERGQE